MPVVCTVHQQPGSRQLCLCLPLWYGWDGMGVSYEVSKLIIIITFKGAIQDFLPPHSAANRLQHIRSSGPGAIVCKSRATHRALITCKCHVTCHLLRRDSSSVEFDRVEITFI